MTEQAGAGPEGGPGHDDVAGAMAQIDAEIAELTAMLAAKRGGEDGDDPNRDATSS